MTNRSADSSISGYSYQFLITIDHIISGRSDDKFIIEGIEDLDVITTDEKCLNQYKHHPDKDLTNSLIAKPIILMLNHFLENSNEQIQYKLFIHGNKNNRNTLTEHDLENILTLSTGENFKKDEYSSDYKDEKKLKEFLSKFSLVVTVGFEELESKVIKKISEKLVLKEEEVRLSMYPLAYKYINDLARKKNEEDRVITGNEFLVYLKGAKKTVNLSTLARIKGESDLVKYIKNELEGLYIKKNTSDHVFFLNNENDEKTTDLIISLSQWFVYQKRNADNRVPIFIVKNIGEMKKYLLKKIKERNIDLFYNDGYEDIIFYDKKFNQTISIKKMASAKKIELVNNFNFKLISMETFEQNKDSIKSSFSNPVFFYLFDYEGEGLDFFREYKLTNIDIHKIPEIFKGDS